jgi:hypothetical protein
MGITPKEVAMPGDRDYIERGLAAAKAYANGEDVLDSAQTNQVAPDVAERAVRRSNRGGGEYHVIDVGRAARRIGSVGLSPFHPDFFGTPYISFRRQPLPGIGPFLIHRPPELL